MTTQHDQMAEEKDEMASLLARRESKINELETLVYQLKQRIEELERTEE